MPAKGVGRHAPLLLVVVAAGITGFGTYRWWLQRSVTSALPEAGTPAPVGGAAPAADSTAATATAGAPRKIPETLPDVTLQDLAGKRHALTEYSGRPLLVNFWATWCAPCRREIPLLRQLRHRYAADRLEVLGIAIDFRDAVSTYVKTSPIDYPLLVGEQDGIDVAQLFGMDLVLPFSVFADARGRIIAVKIGELHEDEAVATLSALHDISAGKLDLATARDQIREKFRQLATKRALARTT